MWKAREWRARYLCNQAINQSAWLIDKTKNTALSPKLSPWRTYYLSIITTEIDSYILSTIIVSSTDISSLTSLVHIITVLCNIYDHDFTYKIMKKVQPKHGLRGLYIVFYMLGS